MTTLSVHCILPLGNSPSGGTPPENGKEDQLWHGPPALDEHVVDPGLTVGATATTAASQELVKMAQHFAATNSMAGHMVLLYAGMLEVRDMAEKFQQNSTWSIPDVLSV
ncbi:hypothetical protein PILCRDRAFT_10518 [Piloderma croceum F 1598]|uniref:Uncharacterized protein n=1 Tax=Piloderma croceum (strain F 1598) TaxID=765440 RepID=A0A0C3BPZ6_PILCF|nr:hypothetical protein PILCRDRAFT_10518 [Piloderma croceum F 1598]